MFEPQKQPPYARPAGESDEEYSSDDEDFDMPGFSSRNKRRNVIQPSVESQHCNGNGHVNNLSNGNGVDVEDDWASAPSKSNFSRTPAEEIRFCCSNGNLEELKTALEMGNFEVNSFFSDETTPLITAANHCHPEIVEFLLSNGANVNYCHHILKCTALMAAVATLEGRETVTAASIFKCVKLLIEAKAEVNRQDRFSLSALGIAVKRKRLEIVKYLLENDADPNLIDSTGRTCLFYAVEIGDGRTCRILLEKGADIYAVDDAGWSAPEIANDKGFDKLGELLHIVQETKWQPGLNPKLMLEIDDEASAKKALLSMTFDNLGIRENTQLEMQLVALHAEKYLELFQKHKISYVQFLQLDEEQLKEIGIEEVGIRQKMLDAIHEIHASVEWQQKAVPVVQSNKKVTTAEVVCIVNNIKLHLLHIATTLKYVRNRIMKDPQHLQYGKERNKIHDIITMCKEMGDNNVGLEKELLGLLQVLQGLESNTEFRLGDEMKPITVEDFMTRWNKKKNSKNDSWWKYKWIFGVAGGIAVLSGIFSSRFRNAVLRR